MKTQRSKLPYVRLLLFLLIGALSCNGQTNKFPAQSLTVMTDTNGHLIQPTNFFSANGVTTNTNAISTNTLNNYYQPTNAALTTLGASNGAALTNLNASALASGTVAAARLTNGIPSGGIIMWSGTIATVPSGWHLCDGTSGTPDLRNKFVVCANADVSGTAKTTLTGSATVSGGSITHAHSINDPGHSHSISAHQMSEINTFPGGEFDDLNPGSVNAYSLVGNTDSGTTGITVNSVDAPQPYYALAFIMKL